jgi:protein ImuA
MEWLLRPARALPEETTLLLGAPALDSALGGGLASHRVHEIVPGGPFQLGAAAGFALAIAARNPRAGLLIWIQQGIVALEGGAPYAPGGALFGFPASRLLVVRAPHARDALWAMEESLRCPGVSSVIGEFAGAGEAADLTATRRLNLVAKEQGTLPLLLRQQPLRGTSACATRWGVRATPGRSDGFGGIGGTAFTLTLEKNRYGPCGNWGVEWDHENQSFRPALPVAVAAPSRHRPHHAA